jgi:NADPH:quinone reductase
MKAVAMTGVGGIDMLQVLDLPEPAPGPGQVLVEIRAAGVNFMDIGVRQGMAWHDMPLPRVLGVEGAGRVVALGEGAGGLEVGQRVAWVYAPGSYAERVLVPAAAPVPLPDDIDDRTAAALMMQGLTASHFATDFYPVQPGDVALVHAAAGGLGQLLTQIVKLRGGTVIGRVSSAAKTDASSSMPAATSPRRCSG